MGCISSKLVTKSGSFSEKVNQSFQKRTNVLEEILISSSKSNSEQQFLALLCTTNAVTRQLKSNSQSGESEPRNSITNEPHSDPSPPIEPAKIETINTWELLAGLEDEDEHESKEEREAEQILNKDSNNSNDGTLKSKSFRTIEDVDEILTSTETNSENQENERKESNEENDTSSSSSNSSTISSGAKRKAMARELSELKVPVFEFAKSGSLRDWLLKGGQIFSPGSYVTPKFGSSIQKDTENDDELNEKAVFDPEMVAQFEQALEQMRREEENILREIVESLVENNEPEISSSLEL